MQHILILCTGNICRSPMAEGLFRHRLKNKNLQISSAGISAVVDAPAVPFAQEIMREKCDIDISHHRAHQVTKEELLKADLIFVMEQKQKEYLEFYLQTLCGRVRRLGQWSGFDIVDPYQRSKDVFEQTFVLIEQCFNDWQARLWT